MASATPLIPPPQTTIGLAGRRKLTLGAQLGRGSEATVYRGVLEEDHFLRRAVAVKVFDAVTPDDTDVATIPLARAAQRASCIRHPNVAATYELAILESRQPAIVSELIEGATLVSLVDRFARTGRRVPLDLSLFITTEIGEALHGARMARTPEAVHIGGPHLDLSAHQVMLSWNGEVKVTDFGIGHAARLASSIRSLRTIARRASTMAPEIARGRPGDTRSDVFSLGIMLREMLIGPRFATTVTETQAMEHARDGFVPSTFLELQLPKDVRTILRRALEVDASKRYPHATAMAYELRRVALSMGVGDGRMFLRSALAKEHAAELAATTQIVEDEPTDEMQIDVVGGSRADRTSGLIRKAEKQDDEDDDDL
jgi:serine/threonine-protein kinase